ncbi:MAG TPA: mobile mystery protein A [Caulobacteraceae bacterium]|nr:mobile mystery protein A [Caulobacteraceae bacterium]
MRSQSNAPALARKHLDRRLASLRAEDLTRPPRGWIRAIREAIGMTAAQLGERTGASQSRIARIEKGEVRGTLTMNTLRHVAEAMGCTLVYALVPNRPLDEMLRERAQDVADRQLARTHQTMRLENQALTPDDLRAERERLVAALLQGDPRRLWDAR